MLERVPEGARILDVGIGTGGALVGNADLLQRRNLHVTGIDIDPDYVSRCVDLVRARGLDDRIEARLESVYDHTGGPYDAAYFSASFMLLPDPQGALAHVGALLAPAGQLYFTQTFENERSPFMERFKPMLRSLTTIDFGRVTYEEDFRSELMSSGAEILELTRLGGNRMRSYHLAVAKPPSSSPS